MRGGVKSSQVKYRLEGRRTTENYSKHAIKQASEEATVHVQYCVCVPAPPSSFCTRRVPGGVAVARARVKVAGWVRVRGLSIIPKGHGIHVHTRVRTRDDTVARVVASVGVLSLTSQS